MDQDGFPQDQPPGGNMPPGQFPQQQFPQQGYPGYYTYPEQSQATTSLVLGILGIVFCAFCAPFAWSIGNKELAAIDAGRRDPAKRDQATAGKILGIIGVALMILSIVLIIVMFLFFGLFAGAAAVG